MKAVRLEIVEMDRDSRQLLYGLSEQMREATNFVWREWEAWHTMRDTADRLRACLERDRQWRTVDKLARGKRPKWDVAPWPAELANDLYRKLTRRFPGLNSRALVLLLNRLRGNITTKQSGAIAAKWWIAILLDKDGRGVARHAQPLLFDAANAKIFPADDKGRVWLEMRLDRIVRPGKKNGTSTVIRAALKTGGKRAAYALPAIEMAAGKRPLRGAQVVYDARKRKWFAALSYDEAVKRNQCAGKLEAGRVAVLRPGRKHCWLLRIPGRRTWWMGGDGHHVAHVRRSLLLQRWSRQHGYTYAPPRKGRGTRAALGPLFKLSLRWRNFTKARNNEVTTDCLRRLVDSGCGTVVLIGGNETRLLAGAGKVEGREDSTGWPWHQVEQLLEQKCNRLGIAVVKRPLFSGANRAQQQPLKTVGA